MVILEEIEMGITEIKNTIFENLQDKLYQKIIRKKPNKKYWLTWHDGKTEIPYPADEYCCNWWLSK